MPQRGREWPVDYRGRIDLAAQTVELEIVPPQGQPMPVSVRFRALDLLCSAALGRGLHGSPSCRWPAWSRWRAISARRCPNNSARKADIEGAIGFSREAGLQGQVLGPRRVCVRARSAGAQDRTGAHRSGSRPGARRSFHRRDRGRPRRAGGGRVPHRRADARRCRSQPAAWRPATFARFPRDVRRAAHPAAGGVRGRQLAGMGALPARRRGRGTWTGAVELRDVRLAVDGLSEPVLRAVGQRADRRGQAGAEQGSRAGGQDRFRGRVPARGRRPRPDRFRFSVPKPAPRNWSASSLPRCAASGGLIARTLRLVRGGVPDWLAARRAEGTIEIGALTAEDLRWES